MKTRLDIYLTSKEFFKSRTYSQKAIASGEVLVNGEMIKKSSFLVDDNDKIDVTSDIPEFVGRGGYKLKAAILQFGLIISGLICADLGASTGGFTDCLLQNGAKKVYAVDVGRDQLDPKLRNNERVINIEGMNVRDIDGKTFEESIDFVCADLSFISLSYALNPIKSILKPNGEAVVLVKPQFEAGKSALNKNGIVKNPKDHIYSLNKICDECNIIGLSVKSVIHSPITGGDGNKEYLLHLVNCAEKTCIDAAGIVKSAFENLR